MGDPKVTTFEKGADWQDLGASDPSVLSAPVCNSNCHASPSAIKKPQAFPLLSGSDFNKFGSAKFKSPLLFAEASPLASKEDPHSPDSINPKDPTSQTSQAPGWGETKNQYYLQLAGENEARAEKSTQAPEKIRLLAEALRIYEKAGDAEKMKAVLQKLAPLYRSQKNELGQLSSECQLALLSGDSALALQKAQDLEKLAEAETGDLPKQIEKFQITLYFFQKLGQSEKVQGLSKKIEGCLRLQAEDFLKLSEKSGILDSEKLKSLENALILYQRLGDTDKAKAVQEKILPLYRKLGEQEEKLAKIASDPAQRIAHFEAALTGYRFCQDEATVKRILGSIRQEYQKLKNEAGVAKVDAELAFIEGRFDEALKNYRSLELLFKNPAAKLSQEERFAALEDVNLKISMTLQALGTKEAQAKHFDAALGDFEEALARTPSQKLTDLTVSLYIQSGKGNLRAKQQEIARLEDQILRMKWPQPCGNCHEASKPRDDWKKGLLNQDLGLPGFPKITKKPKLDLSAYDDLKHLSEKEKEAIYWKDQDLKALKADYEKAKGHLTAIVRKGLGAEVQGSARLLREEFLAKKLTLAGDPDAAIVVLKDLLAEHQGDSDPSWRVSISHEIALNYQQKGLQELVTRGVTTLDFKDALSTLDAAYADLNSSPVANNKEFLQVQNRFLRAELLLTTANTPEQVEEATKALKEILDQHPAYVKEDKGDNPLQALLGRVELRLAQVYFSRKDTMDKGHCLAQDVIRLHPNDDYLVSQAMAARGLAKLQTSQAVEGLRLLREVQLKYPGTEAAEAIRTSPKLASVRGADGILKENINEADIGEALKVALDRSGDTPAWRKMGLAGVGVLIAVILAPEITLPALAVGAGGGLLADRAIGVVEHRRDIGDAYRTGMSDVDLQRNLMNLFMLGLDVAMLFTAGAGGSLAKNLTKAGLSRLALEGSEVVAGWGLGLFEKQTFSYYAGKAAMWTLPRAAETATAYTIYKAEKTLFLGEEFKWKPEEALLMFAMCESFNLARELGLGARLSVNPKFASGKLSPVVFENKVIGYTNSAGRLAGWAADATLGATGYYGLLLGIHATGKGLPGGLPSPDQFLLDQYVTLGALHLGAKVAGKISGQVLDNALLKLDQRSNEWLKKAKENIERGPGPGGGFSWGPSLAYAGAYPTMEIPKGAEPSPKGATVMMMGQWNPSESGSSTARDKNDLMGNNSARNDEVKIVSDLVEARMREEGVERKLGKEDLRIIQAYLKVYRDGIGPKNSEALREAFPEIAEQIAAEFLGTRIKNLTKWVANDNHTPGPYERPLTLRESASSYIDSMIDRALRHKKSSLSPNDPAATKFKDVLRSRFLAELESYLSQNPEIGSLQDLEMYGFFNGKMSFTVDYLVKVAGDPALLEKDSRGLVAPKSAAEASAKAATKTATKTAAEGLPGTAEEAVELELSQLHLKKQNDVTEWLGGRDLSSLSEAQQKELILHLTQAKKWDRADLQKLIGVGGMRKFLGYGTELPFGFESVQQWKTFQKRLMTELAAAGVPIHDPRVKVVLQGSAVKGTSHETKNGTPFRWKGDWRSEVKDYRRPSDFDIAVIVDQGLFERFRSKSLEWIREREGPAKEGRVELDSKRIEKEKRLASADLDSDLQEHLLNLRKAYGQRPIQISIMGPGCHLIPTPAEMMVISADMAAGTP